MSTAALTQPLKWHGGKAYLADWIIGHMPPRVKNPNAPAPGDPGWLHYVEPFAGGLAVLLAQDPEGISEVGRAQRQMSPTCTFFGTNQQERADATVS